MRASEELPNNLSTSSKAANEKQSEEEVFFEKLIAECRAKRITLPQQFAAAVHTAIASGLTFEQIWQRCKWFYSNQSNWPPQFRPGALHDGLAKATPDMPASEGWPYQAGQVEARR